MTKPLFDDLPPGTRTRAMTGDMSPDYVTNKAISLLKQLHGITFITKEFGGTERKERPDALLFNSGGTFLVETKVTRQDFKNDAHKESRIYPERGVGRYRYYACPEGLIAPEELPERWGLIYVLPGNKRAYMPVGHGGWIKIREFKCPVKGFTEAIFELHGSAIDIPSDRKSPNHPSKKFEFKERDLHVEWDYMYALCGRLREGKFLQNIWVSA